MTELWLPVVGLEDRYEVSNEGRIRSVARSLIDNLGRNYHLPSRILRQFPKRRGHLGLRLSGPGGVRGYQVHRLVLTAFVGPCPEGMECCHNDGNAANNVVENLRWDTRKANAHDKIAHGTAPYMDKTKCPFEHELIAPNLVVNHQLRLHRACLACARARARLMHYPELDHQVTADIYYVAIMTGAEPKLERPAGRLDRRTPDVALHTRWHVNRRITKLGCRHCA